MAAEEPRFDPPIQAGVVVGFDASESSRQAVLEAGRIADLRGLALHVLRAWTLSTALDEVAMPPGQVPTIDEVEQAVRESVDAVVAEARQAFPTLSVHGHVHHGKAVSALVAASREAELLVVSRRGQGGFVDLLLGSTADQIVRHATCSVLVVRPRPAA